MPALLPLRRCRLPTRLVLGLGPNVLLVEGAYLVPIRGVRPAEVLRHATPGWSRHRTAGGHVGPILLVARPHRDAVLAFTEQPQVGPFPDLGRVDAPPLLGLPAVDPRRPLG